MLIADATLGWTNRAGFSGARRMNDGAVWQVSIDDDGRRVLDLPSRDAGPRLVALGDSFVFGDGVDPEQHFLHRLGLDLGTAIVNLGVVGYSTDQELLAFQRYRGDCDILLLATYLSNDLQGILSHSAGLRFKPKYVKLDDGLEYRPLPHPLLNRLRHESYLATLTLRALRRAAPALFDEPESSRGEEDAWGIYLELVERIVDEAVRRGASRVVILLWSHDDTRRAPHDAADLERRFTDRGVKVIDLDRIIAERGLDPRALYYSGAVDPGGHWNAEGHALVAEVMRAVLLHELPIQIPERKTRTPPTITWNEAVRNGVSM